METLFEPATLPDDLHNDPRVKTATRNAAEALEALRALQQRQQTLSASLPLREAAVRAARVAEGLGEAYNAEPAERLAEARAELADLAERIPVQEQVLQEYRRRLDAALDDAARAVQALAIEQAERLQGELLDLIAATAAKNDELQALYRWRLRFVAVTDRTIQFRRPIVPMIDLLPNDSDPQRGTGIGRFIRSLEAAGIDPGALTQYR